MKAKSSTATNFIRSFYDPVVSFPCSASSVNHFKKAKLHSGSVINTASTRDSTIIYDGNVGIVAGLVENELCKYIVCKKFFLVEDFFKKPICSSKVGIYLVDRLGESYEIIEFDHCVKKGFLLPYRAKYVALELIHDVL